MKQWGKSDPWGQLGSGVGPSFHLWTRVQDFWALQCNTFTRSGEMLTSCRCSWKQQERCFVCILWHVTYCWSQRPKSQQSQTRCPKLANCFVLHLFVLQPPVTELVGYCPAVVAWRWRSMVIPHKRGEVMTVVRKSVWRLELCPQYSV